MTFRAFVSVDVGPLDGLTRLHGELVDLARRGAALKVVDPELYHLTLKFLGDVPDDAVPGIVEAMERAASKAEPFTCRLRGVGAFPDTGYIAVVWAGIEGADALADVAASLNEDLAHLRDEKRPFSPHLTLARMKGASGKEEVQAFLKTHADDALDELTVDAIRLKRSELGPEGPSYSTVEEVALGGGGGAGAGGRGGGGTEEE